MGQGNDGPLQSDREFQRRVSRALRETGYFPPDGVSVTVRNGQVTLAGTVSSYYGKQLAQAAALSVPGIEHLRNELVVTSPGTSNEVHLVARNADGTSSRLPTNAPAHGTWLNGGRPWQ